MFYFHEILQRRGKFGVLWMAATLPKHLNKRDVYAVDLVRSSNDVIEVLTQYPTLAGARNVHFSLYLSSQLMFGLASVSHLQAKMLLDEVKNLYAKLRTVHQPLGPVDLQEPVSGFRVTFKEPDLRNAPIDFGSFSISYASSINLPSYEYFIVSTPQSSEEWQISPGFPTLEPAELVDVGDVLTSRREDITMPERVPDRSEDPFPENILEEVEGTDFIDEALLPPAAVPDREMPQRVPERDQTVPGEETVIPPQTEADEGISQIPEQIVVTPDVIPVSTEPVSSGQQEITDFRTPEAPVTPPERRKRDRSPGEGDQTALPLPEKDQPEKKAKKSLFGDSQKSEASFVLPPPPAAGTVRQRRRRIPHLIVDAETTLPRAALMRNMELANERLVIPLIPPTLQESADAMLSRFGSRAAAHGNRRFWPKLRTLPENSDPLGFGYSIEPPEVVPEVPALDITVPEATLEDLRIEPREEPRAQDVSEDVTGGDVSGAPSKDLISLRQSRLLQESGEQTSSTKLSLVAPEISVPDTSGRFPLDEYAAEYVLAEMEEEPKPFISEPPRERARQDAEEEDIPAQRRKEPCVIIVSPERTPPPPSPYVPTSPAIQQVIGYIREALIESPEPNLTTFTSVLDKTPVTKTKMHVAKMFSRILSLHASGVIYVEQPVPGREIFISKGPNFDIAYCSPCST